MSNRYERGIGECDFHSRGAAPLTWWPDVADDRAVVRIVCGDGHPGVLFYQVSETGEINQPLVCAWLGCDQELSGVLVDWDGNYSLGKAV
ncbi:hypothetical protein LCGC14_2166950 [marine sediment metagenome]|uniref:Uncharacterized protein n=1 Tax=marine sediment metagenome TaxID=412755 RepID=A0A0F9G3Y0_9ZZZZ